MKLIQIIPCMDSVFRGWKLRVTWITRYTWNGPSSQHKSWYGTGSDYIQCRSNKTNYMKRHHYFSVSYIFERVRVNLLRWLTIPTNCLTLIDWNWYICIFIHWISISLMNCDHFTWQALYYDFLRIGCMHLPFWPYHLHLLHLVSI